MTLFDTITSDTVDTINETIENALADLNRRSDYLGSVGTGDLQKLYHMLEALPVDFDYEHVYGAIWGVLVSLSLTSDTFLAGDLAAEIADTITDAREEALV